MTEHQFYPSNPPPHPYPTHHSLLSYFPAQPYETILNQQPYNCQPRPRTQPYLIKEPLMEIQPDNEIDRLRSNYLYKNDQNFKDFYQNEYEIDQQLIRNRKINDIDLYGASRQNFNEYDKIDHTKPQQTINFYRKTNEQQQFFDKQQTIRDGWREQPYLHQTQIRPHYQQSPRGRDPNKHTQNLVDNQQRNFRENRHKTKFIEDPFLDYQNSDKEYYSKYYKNIDSYPNPSRMNGYYLRHSVDIYDKFYNNKGSEINQRTLYSRNGFI